MVAIPTGLQAGRIFLWLFSIMLPVFNATGDAVLTFQVGVFANFIGGFITIVGAYTLAFLPIIIIFTIGEVGAGIQAIEQGIKAGEDFNTTKPLVIAGVANIISVFFGNPFSLGMYWGYPAWKKINAFT